MIPTEVASVPGRTRDRHPSESGRPRRLGVVDLDAGFSGITRYVLALLRGLDPAEFEVVLFCRPEPHYSGLTGVRVVDITRAVDGTTTAITKGPSRHPLISARSRARRLWRRFAPRPATHTVGFLRNAWRLSRLIRAEHLDLLHVQVVGDAEGAVGGRLAGVPGVVGTYHITIQDDGGRWLPDVLTTRSLAHAVFVSESTRDEWCRRRQFAPDRISVIPNGVEISPVRWPAYRAQARQELGLPEGQGPVIVSVGRLVEQKGHRYLLEAAAALAGEFPDLRVVLAGTGELQNELAALAHRLGLEPQVTFLGHYPNVQSVLDAGDVFALPSLWEAMPFALLEAMASGIPVVATPVDGVPELVRPGETGLLAPAADAPALAGAIRTMLRAPDQARQLAAAARDRVVSRYSSHVMLAATRAMYQQLIRTYCEHTPARGRQGALTTS